MADKKPTFQSMNGCSACRHAADNDPTGSPAAVHGKGFWCTIRGTLVDSKDGAECPKWELSA
jgi:hypothetical protein